MTDLKGVGPKRARLFARKGLHSIIDLLFFIPIRYEDRTRVSPLVSAKEDVPVLVKGRVLSGKEERFYPSRKRLYRIVIGDDRGKLELLWFQYRKPHLDSLVIPGQVLLAYGTIKAIRGKRQMIHPEIQPDREVRTDLTIRLDADGILGFYPVYSSVKGVTPNVLRALIRATLDDYSDAVFDPVPAGITRRLDLPELSDALRHVHFPPMASAVEKLNRLETPYHKRLIFDRFFIIMLTIIFRKK